jgi:pyridoxine kinase
MLTVIGSTIQSDATPRLFRIDVPSLDCFFSGTGDMFAALTVARLREAVFAADSDLRNVASWISPDDVSPTALPLAKATEKVLSSMQDVLKKTMEARNTELHSSSSPAYAGKNLTEDESQKVDHLWKTKAAEIRLVRNVDLLRRPVSKLKAQPWLE